jgi:multiple sugar transport system permease protein
MSRPRVGYRGGLALLLTPFAAGALVLVVLPAIASAYFAVTRYDGLSPPRVVGPVVFSELLADPEVHDSLRATAIIAGLAVPLRLLGALGLAMLLHRRERLAAAGRVAAYAPVVTPDAATALVWIWVVNPVYGPVGVLARLLGVDAGPLLLDPWGARAVIVAISVLALGEGFLVTLAARRELPAALYDVARAEGAGAWASFRRVTLPLLVPVLGLLAARDIATSMQTALVPTLLVTRAGPLNATKTLPALIHERGFRELRFGDAAALTLVLFALTALLVLLQLRLLRRWSWNARG